MKTIMWRVQRIFIPCIILALPFFITSCAIQYVDKKTDTTHLFGFGHMKVRIPEQREGMNAIVSSVEVFGLSTGVDSGEWHVAAGWHKNILLRVTDDSSVKLLWPNNNVFDIHVGSFPPFLVEREVKTNSNPQELEEKNK